MEVTKQTVSEIFHGQQTVGTSRVQLTTLDFPCLKGVLVRCPGSSDPEANTHPVWVGGSGVTSSGATGGMPVLPGNSIFVPAESPHLLWIISTALSQKVAWIGM